jgi:hypothetical protein
MKDSREIPENVLWTSSSVPCAPETQEKFQITRKHVKYYGANKIFRGRRFLMINYVKLRLCVWKECCVALQNNYAKVWCTKGREERT